MTAGVVSMARALTAAAFGILRRLLPRGVRLRWEVGNQLPVLPVLSGQLRDTAAHIEQSIVRTCATFQGMSERAQQSVSAARAALGHEGGTAASFDAIVQTAQQTLQQLLERNLQSAELSRQAAQRVESLEQAMAHIVAISRQVDSIAFGIKILALNAKIEAVHVGQSGAGFGVVADEITRHAEESTKVADDIRATLDAQLKGIHETRKTLSHLSSSDSEGVAMSRQEVGRALQLLAATNSRMQASVGEAAETSRALAEDIASAVTGLQFQDRVTQRISHVVAAIDRVHTSLGEALNEPVGPVAAGPVVAGPAARRDAIAELRATYTMAEELRPDLRPTGTESASGSVELF